MHHVFEPAGSLDGLSASIKECLKSYAPPGLMILAGNKNGFSPESIDPILKAVPVPVFGGTFPGVLHGQQLHQHGTLVLALPAAPRLKIIQGLHDPECDLSDQLDDDLLGENGRTMIVFVDGLAMRVGELLASLFYFYGLETNYIGGGAGALRAESVPCLMTNEGLIRDAAILAVLDTPSGVGVSHGMESVSGPHKVGDICGNRIGSIDFEPARKQFHTLITRIDPSLHHTEGFPISNEFCLAVNRLGAEKVIRDPFKTDSDDGLYVIDELSEGAFVDIVRASPEGLIAAAGRALNLARSSYDGTTPYESVLCFDCFTRWQFLGEQYSEELNALQDGKCELLGALTLGGEIANCGRDFLDYYNRTCVVSVIGGADAASQ